MTGGKMMGATATADKMDGWRVAPAALAVLQQVQKPLYEQNTKDRSDEDFLLDNGIKAATGHASTRAKYGLRAKARGE